MKRQAVVIPFPFSDLSGTKRVDFADFETGGLSYVSNIRPSKIFTAHKSSLVAVKGKISSAKYKEVIDQIIHIIS